MTDKYRHPAALTAYQAKSEAQKLAFSAIAFEAAVALLRLGILQAISDAGDSGITAAELSKQLGLSEYGVKVLLDMGMTANLVWLDDDRFVLEPGDSLLVTGMWHAIARLQGDTHDFVVLSLPEELDEVAPARRRAPVALLILAAMVLLAAFDVVPVVVAVLLAALAAVFSGCLSMDDGLPSQLVSSVAFGDDTPVSDVDILMVERGREASSAITRRVIDDAIPYCEGR